MSNALMPPKPIGFVEVEDNKYSLSVGSYMNGHLAVMMHTTNGMPYAVVSKNIPSIDIDTDQFFVNWYNLSPVMLDALSECGFFEDTGRRIRPDGSFVELPLWEMKSVITARYVTSVEE